MRYLIFLLLPIVCFGQHMDMNNYAGLTCKPFKTGIAITPRNLFPEEASLFIGIITTKVIDGGPGVGKFNLMIYTPPGVTTDTIGEIFINGSGESGADVNKGFVNGPFYWQKNGWAAPYVLAFAQTPLNYPPNRGDRPYFMIAALKELLNGGYHIDRKRLFMTGLSYGTSYIMQYMQYCPDADYVQPAGLVIMSMNIYGTVGDYNKQTDALAGTDTRLAKVPTWGFCGSSDAFYPAMKHYFDLLIKARYPATFTTYTGGHTGWNAQYDPNLKPLSTVSWIQQKAALAVPPPVIVTPNKYPIPSLKTSNGNSWVLLDGSASIDPDGTIDSASITQVSGPVSSKMIFNPCSMQAAAVDLIPGTYIYKITVTDNQKASVSLLTTVIIPAPVKTPIFGKTITVYSDGSYIVQ